MVMGLAEFIRERESTDMCTVHRKLDVAEHQLLSSAWIRKYKSTEPGPGTKPIPHHYYSKKVGKQKTEDCEHLIDEGSPPLTKSEVDSAWIKSLRSSKKKRSFPWVPPEGDPPYVYGENINSIKVSHLPPREVFTYPQRPHVRPQFGRPAVGSQLNLLLTRDHTKVSHETTGDQFSQIPPPPSRSMGDKTQRSRSKTPGQPTSGKRSGQYIKVDRPGREGKNPDGDTIKRKKNSTPSPRTWEDTGNSLYGLGRSPRYVLSQAGSYPPHSLRPKSAPDGSLGDSKVSSGYHHPEFRFPTDDNRIFNSDDSGNQHEITSQRSTDFLDLIGLFEEPEALLHDPEFSNIPKQVQDAVRSSIYLSTERLPTEEDTEDASLADSAAKTTPHESKLHLLDVTGPPFVSSNLMGSPKALNAIQPNNPTAAELSAGKSDGKPIVSPLPSTKNSTGIVQDRGPFFKQIICAVPQVYRGAKLNNDGGENSRETNIQVTTQPAEASKPITVPRPKILVKKKVSNLQLKKNGMQKMVKKQAHMVGLRNPPQESHKNALNKKQEGHLDMDLSRNFGQAESDKVTNQDTNFVRRTQDTLGIKIGTVYSDRPRMRTYLQSYILKSGVQLPIYDGYLQQYYIQRLRDKMAEVHDEPRPQVPVSTLPTVASRVGSAPTKAKRKINVTKKLPTGPSPLTDSAVTEMCSTAPACRQETTQSESGKICDDERSVQGKENFRILSTELSDVISRPSESFITQLDMRRHEKSGEQNLAPGREPIAELLTQYMELKDYIDTVFKNFVPRSLTSQSGPGTIQMVTSNQPPALEQNEVVPGTLNAVDKPPLTTVEQSYQGTSDFHNGDNGLLETQLSAGSQKEIISIPGDKSSPGDTGPESTLRQDTQMSNDQLQRSSFSSFDVQGQEVDSSPHDTQLPSILTQVGSTENDIQQEYTPVSDDNFRRLSLNISQQQPTQQVLPLESTPPKATSSPPTSSQNSTMSSNQRQSISSVISNMKPDLDRSILVDTGKPKRSSQIVVSSSEPGTLKRRSLSYTEGQKSWTKISFTETQESWDERVSGKRSVIDNHGAPPLSPTRVDETPKVSSNYISKTEGPDSLKSNDVTTTSSDEALEISTSRNWTPRRSSLPQSTQLPSNPSQIQSNMRRKSTGGVKLSLAHSETLFRWFQRPTISLSKIAPFLISSKDPTNTTGEVSQSSTSDDIQLHTLHASPTTPITTDFNPVMLVPNTDTSRPENTTVGDIAMTTPLSSDEPLISQPDQVRREINSISSQGVISFPYDNGMQGENTTLVQTAVANLSGMEIDLYLPSDSSASYMMSIDAPEENSGSNVIFLAPDSHSSASHPAHDQDLAGNLPSGETDVDLTVESTSSEGKTSTDLNLETLLSQTEPSIVMLSIDKEQPSTERRMSSSGSQPSPTENKMVNGQPSSRKTSLVEGKSSSRRMSLAEENPSSTGNRLVGGQDSVSGIQGSNTVNVLSSSKNSSVPFQFRQRSRSSVTVLRDSERLLFNGPRRNSANGAQSPQQKLLEGKSWLEGSSMHSVSAKWNNPIVSSGEIQDSGKGQHDGGIHHDLKSNQLVATTETISSEKDYGVMRHYSPAFANQNNSPSDMYDSSKLNINPPETPSDFHEPRESIIIHSTTSPQQNSESPSPTFTRGSFVAPSIGTFQEDKNIGANGPAQAAVLDISPEQSVSNPSTMYTTPDGSVAEAPTGNTRSPTAGMKLPKGTFKAKPPLYPKSVYVHPCTACIAAARRPPKTPKYPREIDEDDDEDICLGTILRRSFDPRPGDVLIVKDRRRHHHTDNGYVSFYTKQHQVYNWYVGDFVLRTGNFVGAVKWNVGKGCKLYQRTHDKQWMLVGLVENPERMLPLAVKEEKVGAQSPSFVPRRGDFLIRLQTLEGPSQLEEWTSRVRINPGDILARLYVGDVGLRCDLKEGLEGQVEIYVYGGKDISWIFMGRDICRYRDGHEL